ncbi:MAG TPA: 2OG-Fe(II) oxygenase [Burkholderiaceae bacterium]|nr:2OG-Fe(II) oxygenase [Burkholderiaceae bacterium]
MNNAPSAAAVLPLPDDWQDWLVSNIARGCEDAELAAVMVESGFETRYARIVTATVRSMVDRVRAQGLQLVPESPEAAAGLVVGQPARERRYRADPVRLPAAVEVRAHDREMSIRFTLADPNVALVDGLLSADECARLIRTASGKLQRSEVVDRASGAMAISGVRTSQGTHFGIGENEVVDRLERRIAALTGTRIEQGEPLQVLHYRPGGEYLAHHDYFDPADPGSAAHLRIGGQRVATVVVYLADVEGGGETVFPGIGLSIRPRAGSAAYFEYFSQQGLVDSRCLHAGAPVSRGEKWIATKWLRQSDYRSPD